MIHGREVFGRGVVAVVGAALLFGCTLGSEKKHYVLAEKLWADGQYAAAVQEFEQVSSRDTLSPLGLQALFRGAMTQTLFLGEHRKAIDKFLLYAKYGRDADLVWEAQKHIGDIYFEKLQAYDEAVRHYQLLLKLRPDAPDRQMFLFRIGRSYFHRWAFDEALVAYEKVIDADPHGGWVEKALYEIGVTHMTHGEREREEAGGTTQPFAKAVVAFGRFVGQFPNSPRAEEARFGLAQALEEQDQLEAALEEYNKIRDTFPARKAVETRVTRIQERIMKRKH